MSRPLTLAVPKGRLLDPALALLASMGVQGLDADTRRLLLTRRADGSPVHPAQARRHPDVCRVRRRRPRHRRQGHPARAGAGRVRAGRSRLRLCRLVVAEPRELWERDDPAKWSWVRVATKYPTLTERYFSDARHPGRDRAPGRLDRAGAARRPRRAHRGPRAVGRDAARERPRRGRGDRDLDGAAHRQPRVAQDRACAGERPDRVDAPRARARRSGGRRDDPPARHARDRGRGRGAGARPLALRRGSRHPSERRWRSSPPCAPRATRPCWS